MEFITIDIRIDNSSIYIIDIRTGNSSIYHNRY